jgi:flagellar protein FliS
MQRRLDQYRDTQMLTASPEQLLLHTYDGSIRFLRQAAAAMSNRDLAAQSEAIVRAQQLLLYLMTTLNHEVNPDLASNLTKIYSYLVDRLTYANVNDESGPVEEALELLGELRSAWHEALVQQQGAVQTAGASAAV